MKTQTKCKGWNGDFMANGELRHYNCKGNRTLNSKNSHEESRGLDMCKFCFKRLCDSGGSA